MSSVRMLRPKYFLTDREFPLMENLGLLIFPLRLIKMSQKVQGGSSTRMLRSQCLLTDGQCILIENLGLLILSTFNEILSNSHKQICCFRRSQIQSNNVVHASLNMQYIFLAVLPISVIYLWK